MDISLTPRQERLLHRQVETGRYKSVNEVIDDALRLVEARDRFDDLRAGAIAAEIAAGMASLREGRTVDGDAVFDRLDTELQAEAERGA